MNFKKWIPAILAGTLLLTGVVGVIGISAVKLVSAAAPAARTADLPEPMMGRGPGGGFASEELASALGITTDQLEQAYQSAQEQALAQAVAAGQITQAQADQMKTGGRMPFGMGGGWMQDSGVDFDALLAETLNITPEQLQTAREQAAQARLAQQVADGEITQEQADLMQGRRTLFTNSAFISQMQAAFEKAVQQAVSDGVISQSVADQILAERAENGTPGMGGWMDGGMDGGRMERGMGRGMGGRR